MSSICPQVLLLSRLKNRADNRKCIHRWEEAFPRKGSHLSAHLVHITALLHQLKCLCLLFSFLSRHMVARTVRRLRWPRLQCITLGKFGVFLTVEAHPPGGAGFIRVHELPETRRGKGVRRSMRPLTSAGRIYCGDRQQSQMSVYSSYSSLNNSISSPLLTFSLSLSSYRETAKRYIEIRLWL